MSFNYSVIFILLIGDFLGKFAQMIFILDFHGRKFVYLLFRVLLIVVNGNG